MSPVSEAVLQPGVSLSRLAEVLRWANLLGGGAWSDRRPAGGDGEAGGGGAVPTQEDFESALRALFTLLRERRIDYLLVGGVAMLRYVPGRNTEDIDLLLAVGDLERLPEIRLEDRNEWFAKGRFRGLRVDLLFTANPLFQQVKEQFSTIHRFHEVEVPCATAEGLILLKLFALPSLYRQGDIQRANLYEADLAALIFATRPEMGAFIAQLAPHVSGSDLNELQKIVAEIENRRTRFSD